MTNTKTNHTEIITIVDSKIVNTSQEYRTPLKKDSFYVHRSTNNNQDQTITRDYFKATYYDQNLKMNLPVYAITKADKSVEGCELELIYDIIPDDEKPKEYFISRSSPVNGDFAHSIPSPSKVDYKDFLTSNGDKIPNLDSDCSCCSSIWLWLYIALVCATALVMVCLPQELQPIAIGVFVFAAFGLSCVKMASEDCNEELNKKISFVTKLICPFIKDISFDAKSIITKAKLRYNDVYFVWKAENKWTIKTHNKKLKQEFLHTSQHNNFLVGLFGEKDGKLHYISNIE